MRIDDYGLKFTILSARIMSSVVAAKAPPTEVYDYHGLVEFAKFLVEVDPFNQKIIVMFMISEGKKRLGRAKMICTNGNLVHIMIPFHIYAVPTDDSIENNDYLRKKLASVMPPLTDHGNGMVAAVTI